MGVRIGGKFGPVRVSAGASAGSLFEGLLGLAALGVLALLFVIAIAVFGLVIAFVLGLLPGILVFLMRSTALLKRSRPTVQWLLVLIAACAMTVCCFAVVIVILNFVSNALSGPDQLYETSGDAYFELSGAAYPAFGVGFAISACVILWPLISAAQAQSHAEKALKKTETDASER